MSVEMVLDRLLVKDEFRRHLTLDHTLPARQARYGGFPESHQPRFWRAPAGRGVTRLSPRPAHASTRGPCGCEVTRGPPSAGRINPLYSPSPRYARLRVT